VPPGPRKAPAPQLSVSSRLVLASRRRKRVLAQPAPVRHQGLSAFSPHDLRRTTIRDLLDLTGDLSLCRSLLVTPTH
jgi:hypothetical protein